MKKSHKILIISLIAVLLLLPLFSPLIAHGYNSCVAKVMESRMSRTLKKLDIEVCDSANYHGKLSGNGNGTAYSCVFLIKGEAEKVMASLNEAGLGYYIDYATESRDGAFDISLLEHRDVEFDNKEFAENPSEYFALYAYDEPELSWLGDSDFCSH
jgi:hypothetical protein